MAAGDHLHDCLAYLPYAFEVQFVGYGEVFSMFLELGPTGSSYL